MGSFGSVADAVNSDMWDVIKYMGAGFVMLPLQTSVDFDWTA